MNPPQAAFDFSVRSSWSHPLSTSLENTDAQSHQSVLRWPKQTRKTLFMLLIASDIVYSIFRTEVFSWGWYCTFESFLAAPVETLLVLVGQWIWPTSCVCKPSPWSDWNCSTFSPNSLRFPRGCWPAETLPSSNTCAGEREEEILELLQVSLYCSWTSQRSRPRARSGSAWLSPPSGGKTTWTWSEITSLGVTFWDIFIPLIRNLSAASYFASIMVFLFI